MPKVSVKVIDKVLTDAKANRKYQTSNKDIYIYKNVIIAVPKDGMDIIHFMDMLHNQLDMDWWMIDYIMGQNGIQ